MRATIVIRNFTAVPRLFAGLLLLLAIIGFSPAYAELDAKCLDIYIGTGAIPVGPNATPLELLECQNTARNFHSNPGNYYCKNHTDEYCGKDCSNQSNILLCFTEEEEGDEDKDKEKDGQECEGNPCNPNSGNKHQREIDYQARSGTLSLVRNYHSLNITDGIFGYGWSATGMARLAIDAEQMRIHQATGRSEPWELVNGQWQGDPDSRLALQVEGDGYRLDNPDLSVEYYDTTGLLTRRIGADALTTHFQYDSQGHLERITGPFGRALVFSYNSDNRVESVTTPDGQISYSYDSQGNLIQVSYADGTSRHYHYEDSALPHHLTGLTDERGVRLATWAYQADGKVISSEHAGGVERVTFSYGDNTTQANGALGDSRTYSHQLMHGVRKITEISGDPCATCGNGELQHRSYDADGFLIAYLDWNGNQTQLTRNARHLIERRVEAAGTAEERVTTTEWHPDFDRPVRIVEAQTTTELSYDSERRLVSRTRIDNATSESRSTTFSYHPEGIPGAGLLASVDGPRLDVDDITRYTYDDVGNLIRITNALGHETRITAHDPSGRPLNLIDANGLTTQLEYDGRGRVIQQTVSDGATTRITIFAYDPAGNLSLITTPDGASLHFEYDPAHRLVALQDVDGNRIDYTLDDMGHILEHRISDPNGQLVRQSQQVYNQLGRLITTLDTQGATTGYAYDLNGNLTEATDARQHPTRNVYDALDRLSQTTDALNGVTGYSYDDQGNLTGVTDPNNQTTSYEYDGLGNLVTLNSPDTGITRYTYDEAGNRISQTDAKGQTTTYVYDALNRLIRIDHADGRQSLYDYDSCDQGIGRLCRLTDANTTTEWRYNVYGDLLEKRQTIDGLSLSTTYAYNGQGQLNQMTYPSGVTLSYRYDTQGRLSNIDRDGQTLVSDIAYDPFGPVTGWHWSDGSTERRDYDLDGRLTKQTLGASERTLAFDSNGNITALSDPHTDFQFDYDALNRLIVANDPGTALSWIYDANGNRLSETLDGILSDYQYETGNNRLNQIDSRSYSHDANGNRINDGSHSYGYNSDNRLISVDQGAIARYRHNALGQRIAKTTYTGGDSTDYLALAEAAEQAAQTHRESAANLDAQAQQAEAEATSLNTQAEQAQTQSDQLTQEANDLTTAANEAQLSADEYLQEAAEWRDKAADYRAKIEPDSSNFWQKIKNAVYKALANLADTLAENAEAEAQPYLTQSEDLTRQADNKQAEADQLSQQASNLQQQAQALLAQADQQTQAAEQERILAQQAEAQAAEYRRLADTAGGVVETQTLFVYDESGRLIGEYDSNGHPIQETVYLSELPVATLQEGDTYRIHSDHLGTPRVITDQDKKEVWRWDAKPFGDSPANEDPDQDGTIIQYHLRFPGQYFDQETGLHYNYFRDYDPATGRYLQSDPIGLAGGINTYAYVESDPINWIDPHGLSKFDQFFGLPKKFWNWFHRHPDMKDLKGPDGQVSKDVAKDYYKEWKDLGQPKPDSKGKQRGSADLGLLEWLIPWPVMPSALGCGELDCDYNGIPDHLEDDQNSCK